MVVGRRTAPCTRPPRQPGRQPGRPGPPARRRCKDFCRPWAWGRTPSLGGGGGQWEAARQVTWPG